MINSNFSLVIKLIVFTSLFVFVGCNPEKKGDPTRFKYGIFETPAKGNISKAKITRIDTLQIEEYTETVSISNDSTVTEQLKKHVDTFSIKWKNNFAYTLRMKNPKSDLDKDPIFVQITEVKDSSYNFTLRFGYSNFKQQGTVYKVK